MTASDWVARWNDTICATPELPGVWRRQAGGFRVRGRATDPKTGKLREVNRALPECKKAREAAVTLENELQLVRAGAGSSSTTALPTFADWSVTVFARKVSSGSIVSVRGREKWDWALRVHLIPAFGDVFVDKLTREDVERWKERELMAPRAHTKDDKRTRKVVGGRYKPQTVNTLLEVLRQVTADASDTFNIGDPCRKLENVSKRSHRTYTYEKPNSIAPADVPRFLAEMRVRHPKHYAFVFMGFTTGLRPSSLRPLRRLGPSADVKWETGKLLIRRSHSLGSEVMDSTKTGRDQVLDLDAEQLSVLRWHTDRLEAYIAKLEKKDATAAIAAALRASDLLFPSSPTRWSKGGNFRSPSCLDKAFADVAEVLKLGYHVSPRCMRRTFQDLARAASIGDIVTRAISGHATPEMQRHYSTVAGEEVRAGMAKVIDIATGRERTAA